MIEIFCKNNNQTRKFPAGISLLEIYKELDLNLENALFDEHICIYRASRYKYSGSISAKNKWLAILETSWGILISSAPDTLL